MYIRFEDKEEDDEEEHGDTAIEEMALFPSKYVLSAKFTTK
jgi:hypothetical protein